MAPLFVFDIETVPDCDNARKLYDLPDHLSEEAVGQILFAKRREETGGSDFIRHHLQKIVAISIVYRHKNQFSVWSLGAEDASEKELIQRFFDGIEKYTPQLISWNGSGFDLPVLHYRALLNQVSAPRYWEVGEQDPQFRYNNYLSRYHYRHLDLMDLLAAYQGRANAPLDEMAQLLGFPGKMGLAGGQVFTNYLKGDLKTIRDYCETDVLNTYLIFCRFELFRGRLTVDAYEAELTFIEEQLKQKALPHWDAFLTHWGRGVLC